MSTDLATGHPVQAVASPESLGARVRFSLATILRVSERIAESFVSAYERAFKLPPQEAADIYMQVGVDMARGGRAGEALSALQRTVSLQPENALAWYQLGVVQLQQRATSAALDAFEEARRLGQDGVELSYFMAEALADLERHEEAARELRHVLAEQPDFAEAAYRLGVSLDRLKRHAEAAAAFRQAIAHAPREVSYLQSLGFTLESLGRRDEAIECFKQAVDLQRRARP
jgi:tetratricopeptide (TPR) repeat protein